MEMTLNMNAIEFAPLTFDEKGGKIMFSNLGETELFGVQGGSGCIDPDPFPFIMKDGTIILKKRPETIFPGPIVIH